VSHGSSGSIHDHGSSENHKKSAIHRALGILFMGPDPNCVAISPWESQTRAHESTYVMIDYSRYVGYVFVSRARLAEILGGTREQKF
jgi:hypothetical protein